ncbi:MAG: T9SS type A sorting domain-containing protein [Saprospiraceae bacterium]|nr:T9SS type A sorting domain-containing protein [Saprospiraceae bacterium]
MVLTDIGDAASAADGALIWIADFTTKINDNVVSRDEQIVVKGETTLLGNPVDVALDAKNNLLYVAERAGNNFLAFETPLIEGQQAPLKTLPVPGISAVYLTGSTREEYPITSVVDVNGGGKLQISVFPNPTSDYMDIGIEGPLSDHDGSILEVYDISGKFMLRQTAENGFARIQVENLNTGVYILYMYNDKYRHATKFTKQ